MNRRGFTLIELLTVIAIIGILAGLILPSLSKGKAKGQQIMCMGAARQWAGAMLMYSEDHEDAIPRENAGGGETWDIVRAPENGDVWYNSLARYAGVWAAREHSEPYATFYSKGSQFSCPNAKPLPGLIRKGPQFSRGMNARLMGDIKFQTVSAIEEPSITVAFAEVGMTGETHLENQSEYRGRPHVKWDHTSTRHRGWGNVSFFDGSAKSYKREVLTNNHTTVIRWTPDGNP